VNENTHFFPFAKGIPYKVKNGMYVAPRLDFQYWKEAFENKKAVIICNNGFLENLIATTIAESLREIRPNQEIEWMVNPFYKKLWSINGLGKESAFYIDAEKLKKYPVPLFFNSNNTSVYINSCYNYRTVYTYYGKERYHDQKAVCEQVFRNLMVDWSHLYLPKMRNLRVPDSLERLAASSRFSLSDPYILLIPDVTGMSDHDEQSLDWSLNEIRSFAAMIRNTKYNLVIMSPFPQKYYGIKAFVPPMNVESLLFLMSKSSVILSKEVDFSIGSLLIGNAKTFSLRLKKEFKLEKNKRFLTVENDIVTSKKLSPYYVFQELE